MALTHAEQAILDRLTEAPGGSLFLDPEDADTVRSLEAQGLVEAEYDESYITVVNPHHWDWLGDALKRVTTLEEFDPD